MGDKSLNRHRPAQRVATVFLILVMVFGSLASVATNAQAGSAAAPSADVSTLHLTVISANDSNDVTTNYGITKGQAITEFKYIINIDNTGTTEQRSPAPGTGCSPEDPNYPDSCDWVSVAGRANHSPIYTQGDQSDFPGGTFTIDGQVVNLPAGRYLISILADNFRLDGAHFTVPGSGNVTVEMQPYDLPTATIQAAVFEDMAPTNSAPDLPAERGLAGFRAHINDYVDEVTTDVFGNPLGAQYDASGNYIDGTGGVVLSQCYVVANGVDIGTVAPLDAMGHCPLDFDAANDSMLADAYGSDFVITTTVEGDPIPTGAVIEGKAIIPNVGPNRYALSVSPPDESGWIQTTTLEGNHDWDAWVMEGATGLDTEFVVAGEPFPATFFGFVRPQLNTFANAGGTNTIEGTAYALNAYVPPKGGKITAEGVNGGQPKDGDPRPNPIHRLFISLSDLNNNDQTVYIQEFGCQIDPAQNCDSAPTFTIPNVPDGDYVLGYWDEPQDYLMDFQNISVSGGVTQTVESSLVGWWTPIDGYVFYDTNENGIKDPGEQGIPNFPITQRMRENSLMDRGTPAVTTDNNGYYWMESTYPMNQWLVMEAYADSLHTTGVTYWADNNLDADGNPIKTTVLGAGVDVNFLPVFSQSGHIDWGVKAYNPGENGGIVGTVSYDTTRNELDPAYAAIEDWQPSISNLTVELYAPVPCGTNANAPCDAAGQYELAQDGSYVLGNLLNTYLTETWDRPTGCTALDINGDPLAYGVDQHVLPFDASGPGSQDISKECIEAPLMGVQFGPMATDQGTADANFGATVDGNYGFGDGCFVDANTPGLFDPDTGACVNGDFLNLPSNKDYLVRVDIPDDVFGRPLYQVTKEEDINVANGDSFVPQVPPSPCAGALHTVDVKGATNKKDYFDVVNGNYPAVVGDGTNGLPVGVTVAASTPVENDPFLSMLGNDGVIYDGQQKHLCDTKLIHLRDQRSIAPGFNLFTDVPLPARFWGLIVDDLNWSSNPQQTGYGEKMGIPFAPVGIYDYTNRLITTVESDYNGLFDVLLPSTNRISCPTPSGVCANLFRFVGNDPGTPNHWNANYNPQYRTISAEFEGFAGLTVPADLAPTTVAAVTQLPGSQTLTPVMCTLEDTQPQLLAVSKPYADLSGGAVDFRVQGFGFGANPQVYMDNILLSSTVTPGGTSDTDLTVTVPDDASVGNGTHQLSIQNTDNGLTTINGLTFHVLSSPTAVTAFPDTTVLDEFTGRTILGSNWDFNGGSGGGVGFAPQNDYLRIQTGNGTSVRNAWWTANSFGTNQEAYFDFVQVSGRPDANQQGLLLKYTNSNTDTGANPNDASAQWVEVALDNNGATDLEDMTLRITTKAAGDQPVELLNFEDPQAVFSNTDSLGARALSDGTIIVYKNDLEIVRVASDTGGWDGNIGIRFEGTGNKSTVEARIDNFGGGNVPLAPTTSDTNIITVGPAGGADPDGQPYGANTIQAAIDAAASLGDTNTLVVVYPGAVDNTNPRYNGRGAYYENIIMYAPIQLQGVGPGGVRPDNSIVQGTIIDGIAFGGDTALATNWLAKVSSMNWNGNQDITSGQVIYVLASISDTPTLTQAGSFANTDFKAMIDGFDIRGGTQQGLPANIAEVAMPPADPNAPSVPIPVETQGGAIFANSYVQNLQVTNNVVESNGGSYGAIRIGTPNIAGTPDNGDQHNDNLRIANNRILANGGTNLAGAIGLFNGADNYEVANNDLCGNFSAEYGGGISHYGLSEGGSIHDNRIYYNHSYDEGAGIIIAGQLPTNNASAYGQPGGPQGSGAVAIYNNLIQANMADDDGGGIRFLMVGDYQMDVYNNMIVNNISAHEGGGVAIDDASNVNFYNNTVMNNVTTATAITSDGTPAPAGLSMSANSEALQLALGGINAVNEYTEPNMYNNIFWDNRAGYLNPSSTGPFVLGIGATGDVTPLNHWDVGSVGVYELTSPTYNIFQTSYDLLGDALLGPAHNSFGTDPLVMNGDYHIPMTFTNWGAFVTNIMVTVELQPYLNGDYHLTAGSPAVNYGPAVIGAPSDDFDHDTRDAQPDLGADEYVAAP